MIDLGSMFLNHIYVSLLVSPPPLGSHSLSDLVNKLKIYNIKKGNSNHIAAKRKQ